MSGISLQQRALIGTFCVGYEKFPFHLAIFSHIVKEDFMDCYIFIYLFLSYEGRVDLIKMTCVRYGPFEYFFQIPMDMIGPYAHGFDHHFKLLTKDH